MKTKNPCHARHARHTRAASLLLALLLMLLSVAATGCADKAIAFTDIDFTDVALENCTETDEETDYVMLDVTDYGKIVIRLYPEVAPLTVKNFKELVAAHFYDGLIFHRVINNFMVQTGDPKGDGTGGSDKTIKGEFNNNGVTNNLKHKRGVVSMARLKNDMNSACSQFFIVHKTYPSLDGDYASFGYVVSGMDVVDKIAQAKTNSTDKPYTDIVIASARFVSVSK